MATVKERLAETGAATRRDPLAVYEEWKKSISTYFEWKLNKQILDNFLSHVEQVEHGGYVQKTFEIEYDFDSVPIQFQSAAKTYWMDRFNKICLDNDYIVSIYYSDGTPFDGKRHCYMLMIRVGVTF